MIVSSLMALGQTGLQLWYLLKSSSIFPGHFLVLQKGKVMLSYLPIILRGDSLKTTHSSLFPEETVDHYKGQIYCLGQRHLPVVGDATKIVQNVGPITVQIEFILILACIVCGLSRLALWPRPVSIKLLNGVLCVGCV